MPELPPPVPEARLRTLGARPVRDRPAGATHVLYWMTATRRTGASFTLEHALGEATRLGLPLVVLEALGADHPHASARLADVVARGMVDNHAAVRAAIAAAGGPAAVPLRYLAYLEPRPGAGAGLVRALAADAALVIGDAYPTYHLPALHRALAERIAVPVVLVDAGTVVPMSSAPKAFARAHDLRRWLHAELPAALERGPLPDPLATLLPDLAGAVSAAGWQADAFDAGLDAVLAPWPLLLDARRPGEVEVDVVVGELELAFDVSPVRSTDEPLGPRAAEQRLDVFLDTWLEGYRATTNRPRPTSLLSTALHFGHLGPHQVLGALFEREPWHPEDADPSKRGNRAGWWGLSEHAEGWLDQVLTWRELGWNHALLDPDHARYAGLPAWARQTLEEHAADPRDATYTLEQLEAAETHDEVWNAAQRQLVRDGRIENYLRMLWGKLILAWTPDPAEAFERCLLLNDRYALDGRDPNSYSAIAWVFGKFDRPWGPERPVFGKIRYMTSESTRRKLRLGPYLERYGPGQGELFLD